MTTSHSHSESQWHGWTTSLQIWSSAWARVMRGVFHREIKDCDSTAAHGLGTLVLMQGGTLLLARMRIRVQFIFWGEKESQGCGCSWLAAILLPLNCRVRSAGSVMRRSDSLHPPAIPAPRTTPTSRGYISSASSVSASLPPMTHSHGQQLWNLQRWFFVLWLPVHEEKLPNSHAVVTVLSFQQ